ncbi:hypothetical protein [Methylorubrum extorquens]|uniref:hypothetical protein n=1 Tax=Methylorubrum extorquens TaxID=408 RepID=UPI002237C91C|nr:hypothetical protein [Methylorubrum extorquens]UYW33643.1 hypothetical protein OKB92_06055 [Methylorubrum extorquens]
MAKRQTRPLTPAEAVRQGRKLIAERRRQEAASPPPAAWEGGAEADMGKPITEHDQRVEVVLITPVEPTSTPPDADPTLIFAATIEAAKVNTHPDGAWPLADLRTRQCRFACTADDAPRDQHRFCGRRTHVGPGNLHGSWCDEHLPRVWGQGSVSERNAHHVAKDVRRFG